ncbi:MAG: flagellar hook-associated protein FlgK [Hydrogenophaga sp.]
MSAALNIGARALTTNLAALQVIGNNIANANTTGYSRQTVQTQSAGYQKLGGQFFGKGVELASVTRSHSDYLTREARLASSAAAADSDRYARLQSLEGIFPTGERGIGAAVNSMLNVWNDVASSPADLSARVVALARADDLTARMRETVGQLDTLSLSSHQQVDGTIQSINRLASDLAKINQKVIETQGDAGIPNDLLDQRDQLLAELGQYMNVTTVDADDGSISVFVAGSQPLVLGTSANRLAQVSNPDNPAQKQINVIQGGVSREVPEGSVGGALGGILKFVNQDLPTLQNMIGRMALALETEMNTQHRLGADLNGNPGVDFFVSSGNATAVGAAANTGDAEIHTQVSDPTAMKASNYQITFDGAGVNITRLSDNVSMAFGALPAEMDGLSFQLDTGTGAVGDSYFVRPFAAAARNMQVAIGSPGQLAVASPVMVTPAAANSGGISIESLYAYAPSANLNDTVSINFLANGTFTVSGLGPDNPPPDNAGPPASYSYTPGKALQFNGWSMTLRGTPADGDSFVIEPSPPGANPQNAGNAKAVLALRDLATFDGVSLSEGYGAVLSHIGTAVQSAKFSADYTGQMASNTENARASFSGVNLDEEAARLLQFQQAYQASAKFLQVAQSTFDTLLQTVGR